MKQSRQQRIELLRKITKGQIPEDLKPWENWFQDWDNPDMYNCGKVSATWDQLQARIKSMENRRRFLVVKYVSDSNPGNLTLDISK